MSNLSSGKTTRMPAHPGQPLDFTRNQNFDMGRGFADSFNYIAPVVKYAPAQFQPGPSYRGGEAAAIGNQPWNFSDQWTGYSTPSQMAWAYQPGYRGTQSAASFALAQQAMMQLLQLRSVNASG